MVIDLARQKLMHVSLKVLMLAVLKVVVLIHHVLHPVLHRAQAHRVMIHHVRLLVKSLATRVHNVLALIVQLVTVMALIALQVTARQNAHVALLNLN